LLLPYLQFPVFTGLQLTITHPPRNDFATFRRKVGKKFKSAVLWIIALLHNPATRAPHQHPTLRRSRLLSQPIGFRYALGLVLARKYSFLVVVYFNAPGALLIVAKYMEELHFAVVGEKHSLGDCW